MQIQKLSDAALHGNIKTLVAREREILTDVLKHLLEVDRRKLFSQFRYPSLFEYARVELGYSEDAAYRRIDAMRALREIPALEEKISSGTVTLSGINAAQTIIRAERKVSAVSAERKLELFAAIENKSKREAESTLQAMTTAPKECLRPEKIREIGENIEIRFTANRQLQEKLARVKAELSHIDPQISIAELFEKLCAEFLEQAEKKRRVKSQDITKAQAVAAPTRQSTPAPEKFAPVSGKSVPVSGKSETARKSISKSLHVPASAPPPAPARKSIPASARRFVFARANNQCERCGSIWQLEVDHRKPVALGGGSEILNLRLLCRNCNQRAAIECLGKEKIRKSIEHLARI